MKNLDTYFAYLASLFRRSGAVEDAVQYQSIQAERRVKPSAPGRSGKA